MAWKRSALKQRVPNAHKTIATADFSAFWEKAKPRYNLLRRHKKKTTATVRCAVVCKMDALEGEKKLEWKTM